MSNTLNYARAILGPMFSEKTTLLMSYVSRYEIAKKKVLVIGYLKDKRYSSSNGLISSHDGKTHSAIKIDKSELLGIDTDGYDMIAIDEAQFFENLREFIVKELKGGKMVVFAALNSSYKSEMFPEIISVLPECLELNWLKAVCIPCGNDDAIKSHRKSENDTGELEQIGGANEYEALCFNCWYN